MLQLELWRRWRKTFKVIVANSEATKQRLLAAGIEPVEVIWNGVPPRGWGGPPAAHPTIVFAGRLVREKGADVLVEAFTKILAHFSNAQLLIAGEGPEKARITTQIERLGSGSHVSFLGHISRDDLEKRFRGAWVQIIPSRWQEPFGLAAAEALMRGTAVVASDTGGLAEFIRHGETGILTPPGDVNALAEVLLSLLGRPDRLQEMGRRGREFATRHLTEDTFISRFLDLYRRISDTKELSAAAQQ
jgi:glycosyltransferase involved in cell wall biosynthesis